MRRILVLRHARTASNAEGKYVSASDPDLDAVGVEQARRVASNLSGVPLDRILTSPAKRARQTAELVADAVGWHPGLLVTDPRLAELELGPFEGTGSAELLHGPLADEYRSWRSLNEHTTPEGVEPLDVVAARVRTLLEDQPESSSWLLVTHAFTSRVVLADLLGLPLTRHRVLKLELGHLAVVDWQEGFPRLLQLNVATPTVESGALRDLSS